MATLDENPQVKISTSGIASDESTPRKSSSLTTEAPHPRNRVFYIRPRFIPPSFIHLPPNYQHRSTMHLDLSQSRRLQLVICISLCFFIAEISGNSTQPGTRDFIYSLPSLVGFYTHSLALVADAFHYVRRLLSSHLQNDH